MSFRGERLDRLTPALLPIAIVVLGCSVSLLPRDVVARAADVLAVWLMLSLPIGVLVGHCIPGEAD